MAFPLALISLMILVATAESIVASHDDPFLSVGKIFALNKLPCDLLATFSFFIQILKAQVLKGLISMLHSFLILWT